MMYKMKFHIAIVFTLSLICIFRLEANPLTFHGEIVRHTCTVSVNGEMNALVITLPALAYMTPDQSGATTGDTQFSITLRDCTHPMSGAQSVETTLMGNQVTATGNLRSYGTAENVAVQLHRHGEKGPLYFSPGEFVARKKMTIEERESSASQQFVARFISEKGLATPGSVISSVHYVVAYL